MAIVNPRKCKDLSGQKIGRLTVLERDYETQFHHTRNHIYWKCLCDCGNPITVRARRLNIRSKNKNQAHTRSCGCLQREIAAANGRKKTNTITVAREIWIAYRGRARRMEVPFDLSFEEFLTKTQERCYYCNTIPSNISKHRKIDYEFVWNGIDRINSDLGYIQGNMVTCCETCNKAKRDLTLCDFVRWIDRLSKNIKNIKDHASCFDSKNSVS